MNCPKCNTVLVGPKMAPSCPKCFPTTVAVAELVEFIERNSYERGYRAGGLAAARIVEQMAKEFVENVQVDGTRSSEVYFYGIGCERAQIDLLTHFNNNPKLKIPE